VRSAPLLAGLLGLLAACAAPYDLVVRDALLVDGTGAPARKGGLAVRGDRIVLVGEIPADAVALRTIDARGRALAPGFIDQHAHSDWLLFEDGLAQSKIRQGVTTEVLGEHTSGGPFLGRVPPRLANGREIRTLGDYLSAVEAAGISLNVASYVSQGNVWRCVMGESHERPGPAQIEEMKRLVAQAMDEGAWGLSVMVAEPPGLLATLDDLVALAGESARRGGIYSTHVRNEGAGVLDAVREAIVVGERAGCRVDVIHLKIADQALWGRMNEIVALIEDARARGVDVQANVYPYERGNNNLAAILPPWAREGGTERVLARLRDPADRARIRKDVLAGLPGWYNHYLAVGGDWSRMLVNEDLSAKNKRFEGTTMDRILAERGGAGDALDGWMDFLAEEKASISCIYAHHTEADRDLALKQPWCSIGSDGSAYAIEGPLRRGKPHPRNFGTFPRVLGVFVRERRLLGLEEAVRKMTSLNAEKLGLRDRGVLRAGAVADLVLFDPATVIDRSTYLDPFQYPVGIDTVVVAGQVVLDEGRHSGARPGRALRRGRD
jgi:N-acyl-D-amino-acid deacylase